MKRRPTSVDASVLLDLRQLAIEKQQQGYNVKPHEEVDKALRRYIISERKRLVILVSQQETKEDTK